MRMAFNNVPLFRSVYKRYHWAPVVLGMLQPELGNGKYAHGKRAEWSAPRAIEFGAGYYQAVGNVHTHTATTVSVRKFAFDDVPHDSGSI